MMKFMNCLNETFLAVLDHKTGLAVFNERIDASTAADAYGQDHLPSHPLNYPVCLHSQTVELPRKNLLKLDQVVVEGQQIPT